MPSTHLHRWYAKMPDKMDIRTEATMAKRLPRAMVWLWMLLLPWWRASMAGFMGITPWPESRFSVMVTRVRLAAYVRQFHLRNCLKGTCTYDVRVRKLFGFFTLFTLICKD